MELKGSIINSSTYEYADSLGLSLLKIKKILVTTSNQHWKNDNLDAVFTPQSFKWFTFRVIPSYYIFFHAKALNISLINTLKSYLKPDNFAPQPHTTLSCLN